ncbi:MAG: cupin domain-containing protein [Chloroflexi bacterium]|nr:cupin domain-containing protein [Chloroflexota bacterium]
MNAKEIIKFLNLEPLPIEGGYFRRTYSAEETIARSALPDRYPHAKLLSGTIYYLLHGDHFSALHRLLTDETYHFYLGDPVELLMLRPDGSSEVATLGHDLEAGQHVQYVVPRGVWQGSRLLAGGEFALMGTTMAPAFDPSDFELGQRDDLIRRYPDQADLIRALTRLSMDR